MATAVPQRAADWLERVQQAAQQQNYEGTFVYQRDTFVQSSRLTHYAVQGDGEYEQIESLDGKPRILLRHNDEVYTFLPERHLCVVERRQNKDAFPALLGASGKDVLTVYELKLLGKDRVAGHDAQIMELVPKDAYRFAYKLWADTKTGLLLRSQTLDADGRVLAQIAFTQLNVGVSQEGKNAIIAGMRNLNGWKVVRSPVMPVDINAQGWRIASNVSGFRKSREVRRPMASRDAGEPPIPVDQAVFTDGMATVSVFIEPAEKNIRKEGVGSDGATHVLVKRRGEFWITVLGEVPQLTLQQFASAIEYKPSK